MRACASVAVMAVALSWALGALAQQPAAEAEAIEVTVKGERDQKKSGSEIDRSEIRDVPGQLGDPYRAVESRPGVTPTASGFPYFFIRGAPPGNIGYFFDGIQVPLLFHVGAGPSVIPPSLVRRLDLYFGPYPASIGRLAGAAIDAEATAPATRWRGETAWRGIEADALLEGPATKDVTVLAGGRWAFGAPLLTYLVPSVELGYGDYQARVVATPSPGERWTALGFGAFDYLATVDHGEREVLLDADFHRLDLRYERRRAGTTRVGVTLGLDQSRGGGAELARDYKINVRASVERPAVPGQMLVRAGTDAMLDVYDIHPSTDFCEECEPGSVEAAGDELERIFPTLFPSRVDLALGGWVDALIILDPTSTITPGLRIDHYASRGDTAVGIDPRLTGRFGVSRLLTLVPAVGIASQRPGFAPVPAHQIGGIPGGLQRALQTSFGAEIGKFPLEVTTTVFRHATFNLTDPIGTGRGTDLTLGRFLDRSTGDAYGLELGIRTALRRDLLMLAAYTLSRATRAYGGRTVPSAYDRTHVLHVALLYDLGNNWRAGMRHVLYSGFPADEITETRVASEHPDRTRPFYRMDARLAKRWTVGQSGWVSFALDLQNATLSREVFDVECDDRGCQPRVVGPITIPALAVEAGF